MTGSSTKYDLADIVDLDRYPIDKDGLERKALIERCNSELNETGCSLISKFIRPESLQRMKEEANRLLPEIFWTRKTHNPYFTSIEHEDKSLPESDPRRMYEERHSGYINTDVIPEFSDLAVFYQSELILDFLNLSIGDEKFCMWADPIAKHPYSLMNPGDYFPWHFDANKFTVSILVQNCDDGGFFEYASDLRTKEDEHFNEVAKVIKGDRSRVQQLKLQEGDLQLFKGHFTLHRVTQVESATPRIIALPSYATDPNHVNLPTKSLELYGKALPIHYEREKMERDTMIE